MEPRSPLHLLLSSMRLLLSLVASEPWRRRATRPPQLHRKGESTFDFRLSTFDFRLSTFDFRLSTFDFRLSTFDFRLSTFDFRLSTFDFRLSTFDHPRAGQLLSATILTALTSTRRPEAPLIH